MAKSGLVARGRKLVAVRVTEREQRKYHASLLPKQGCQSWTKQRRTPEAIVTRSADGEGIQSATFTPVDV